jgi:hypothetical protein
VREESGFKMTRQVRIAALSSWSGLAQIWSGQEILGILLGMSFAAALNLAVVGRWIWPDTLPTGWADFFAALAGVTWLARLDDSVWWVRFCQPGRHWIEIDRHFSQAHEAVLQGRWGESRRRIEQVLAMDGSDSGALMQLWAVYVPTNQPTLTRRALRQGLEVKHGAKWRWEIQCKLARLAGGS